MAGKSCVNYAGVMRELCGIDEPRVLQESRRIFMNASEPMGILWGVHTDDAIGFHRIPNHSIGLQKISPGFHRVTWYAMGFRWLA